MVNNLVGNVKEAVLKNNPFPTEAYETWLGMPIVLKGEIKKKSRTVSI